MSIAVSVFRVKTWLSFASLFVFDDLLATEFSIRTVNQTGVLMLLKASADEPVLVQFTFHVNFAIGTWSVGVQVLALVSDLCWLETSVVKSAALVWAPDGAFIRTAARCRSRTIVARV